MSNQVLAVKMSQLGSVFARYFDSEISDAVTLGDLDLDGNVETIVPTADGTLYALNEDGSDFPTDWPFVSLTGSALTSGAIAQCIGNAYREVTVGANDWTVHMVMREGDESPHFPVETGGYWYIYGAPIMARIADRLGVMIGARDMKAWSWNNFGELNHGWPKNLGEKINFSPAYGDIDDDGQAEVVFLTLNQLAVVDLNESVGLPSETWPMYGHDPQRTGCANCPEFIPPSAVPDGEDSATHLRFAVPSPAPLSEPVTFRFALPDYAAVALEIFDVQGRRVCTVSKAEYQAGEHAADWDGHDDNGSSLAAGQYFARLRVRGGGEEQLVTRKLVMIP